MPFTPYDAANHMLDRAEALLDLARTLTRKPTRDALPPGLASAAGRPVRDDLRRLALVMAVAALDTYMHRLVVSRAYLHEDLPLKLADVTVRFGDLIDQADAAVIAHNEGRRSRPRVAAKRLLRERLLRETFQRPDRVTDALSMAGVPKAWSVIAAAMAGAPKPEDLRSTLNALVERRNAIVHEGDYERLDRPQRSTLNAVTTTEAGNAVDFVRQLIDAIHSVVS